ncbi:MAG TPA: helix-turn-helix transcriptional regulator [Steroidobacteraceae bacterium]
MSSSATLIRAIKLRLKAQGLSYRALGALIGISEPTVKRDLARGNFSLQRLDKICDALGVSVTDLLQASEGAPLTELGEQQEQALAADPQALIITYLLVNDWKFDEIVSIFKLTDNQLVSVLLKLDKMRIVDFRPPKRIRKLTARNFSWRKDGAVQAYFLRRVIPEFFDASFDAQGDEFRFVGGLLSASSVLRLQASIRRVAAEYEQLAHQDARLPFAQLNSCSAILASRSWEFSEISKLRRDKAARGSKIMQKP